MLNRWIGISTATLMILANAGIILRDVVPHWLPNDVPPTDAQTLAPDEWRRAQVGVYDDEGRLVGRSWTRANRKGKSDIAVTSTTTVLQRLQLPTGLRTPQVRLETDITYRVSENYVDEVDFRMYGLGLRVSLEGASIVRREFACVWQVGPRRGEFLLDSESPAMLGDVIRPFDRLPQLYVGQTWRLKLLDPLAQVVPGLEESGIELEPLVIRVTRKETIMHRGTPVEAFVVEGGNATAWVAADGRVLRQVVTLPLLGRLTLIDEAYNAETLADAVERVPNDWAQMIDD